VKLRIHADIQQRAPGVFTRKALSVFMHRHTTSNAYLKALLASRQRFDLDGQPAGEVTEEHRAAAREELERRRQVVLARRAVQRPAAGRDAEARGGRPQEHRRPQGAAALPRGPREPRRDRSPRAAQGSRQPRPSSPAGAPSSQPAEFRPRPSRAAEPHRDQVRDAGPHPAPTETGLAGPDDAGRRDRATLLRTFETSSLSKANFCALKRLSEAELDAQLAQARRERGERAAGTPFLRG